jgi:hypothetical protein
MYTYRKQINSSISIAPNTTSSIYTLDLSTFKGTYGLADVEVKASLISATSTSGSTIYYRKLQIASSPATPSYFNFNTSSFAYAEDSTTSVFLNSIGYTQGGTLLYINAFNPNAGGGTLNASYIINIKINNY